MGNGTFSLLVREVNDRIYNVLWGLGSEDGDLGDFACECGEHDCHERVELTLIEYAARDDGQVLLARGHATAGAVPSTLVNP